MEDFQLICAWRKKKKLNAICQPPLIFTLQSFLKWKSFQLWSIVVYALLPSDYSQSCWISILPTQSHMENLLRSLTQKISRETSQVKDMSNGKVAMIFKNTNENILFNKLAFLCRVYNSQSTALWQSVKLKKEKLVKETKKTQNSLVFTNNKYSLCLS